MTRRWIAAALILALAGSTYATALPLASFLEMHLQPLAVVHAHHTAQHSAHHSMAMPAAKNQSCCPPLVIEHLVCAAPLEIASCAAPSCCCVSRAPDGALPKAGTSAPDRTDAGLLPVAAALASLRQGSARPLDFRLDRPPSYSLLSMVSRN